MDDPRLKAVVLGQPFPLLFATVGGAHLYGFPSDNSTYELRGAHVLPLDKVVGLYSEHESIEGRERRDGLEVDVGTHDVRKYLSLLLKRNGFMLEQILSPLVVHGSQAFEELRELAAQCVTPGHAYHYRSAAQTQWKVFERQRRLGPLLDMYRVLLTGIHLMESGRVEVNLMRLNHRFRLPYLGDLISLKLQGSEDILLEDVDLLFHEREWRRLQRQLDDARATCRLPEEPVAKPELHRLLVRVRLEHP